MLSSVILFLNMGGPEVILIFVVVLLLFGGKKLPELARGLGKGLREFKDASDGIKREIHNNINAVTETADLEKMDTTPPSYSSNTSVSSDDTEVKPDVHPEDTKIAH